MGGDMTTPAGEFLKAIFPGLLPDERERIEQTLLSIPDAYPMDRREGAEHIRNRLLGRLARTDLPTDEARHLLMAVEAVHPVLLTEPLVQFGAETITALGGRGRSPPTRVCRSTRRRTRISVTLNGPWRSSQTST